MSSPATFVDSHCHLHYDYAPKTADDLVREAREAGVARLITVGTDLESSRLMASFSEKFPGVHHTVGVHPHETGTLEGPWIEELRALSAHPACRAIGEIGLDYYYKHSDPAAQIARLEDQLNLAVSVKKPVVIHSRDAETDLLPRLLSYAKSFRAATAPDRAVGVLHCFTGTLPFAEACVEAGFYVSFSGILTFKNADDLREVAARLPMNRLLVETDSPYLAPIPMRGKKCEPAFVRFTAMKLAEVRGIPLETLARHTSEAAARVFGP